MDAKPIAFGHGVVTPHYQDVKDVVGYNRTPYTFCAIECLKRIEEWCDESNHIEPISYVFGHGTQHAGEINEAIKIGIASDVRFRLNGPVTVASNKDLNPLRAADMIVWIVNRQLKNYGKPEETRELLHEWLEKLIFGHTLISRFTDQTHFDEFRSRASGDSGD